MKSHQNSITWVPTEVNQHQQFAGNNVYNGFSDLKCFKSSYFDHTSGVLEQVVLTVKVLLQVWATHIDGNGYKMPPFPSTWGLDFLWSLHTHQSQECISVPLEPAGNSAFLFVYNVKAFHKWLRLWRKLCILTFRQLTKARYNKTGPRFIRNGQKIQCRERCRKGESEAKGTRHLRPTLQR